MDPLRKEEAAMNRKALYVILILVFVAILVFQIL